jgi:hypothetical protein
MAASSGIHRSMLRGIHLPGGLHVVVFFCMFQMEATAEVDSINFPSLYKDGNFSTFFRENRQKK